MCFISILPRFSNLDVLVLFAQCKTVFKVHNKIGSHVYLIRFAAGLHSGSNINGIAPNIVSHGSAVSQHAANDGAYIHPYPK